MKALLFLIFLLSSTITFAQGGKGSGADTPLTGGGAVGSITTGGGDISSGIGFQGGSMGGSGAGVELPDLSSIRITNNACSFNNDMTNQDQELITNARSAIAALRADPACQSSVTPDQFNAFDTAMTNFNRYNESDRGGSTPGHVNVNCSNYEQMYDLYFQQFSSGEVSDVDPRSPFYQCGSAEGQERTDCAVRATATLKVTKRHQCEAFQTAMEDETRDQLVAASYRSTMELMNAFLANPNCGTGDEQRSALINSSVGLISRAALLAAGPAAPIVGLAGTLLQNTVGRLLQRGQRSNDPLMQQRDQENFEKVACLYEMVEKRVNRCDTLGALNTAQRTAEVSREAEALCRQDTFNSNTNDFLAQVNALSQRLAPASPPATQSATQDAGSTEEAASTARAPASTQVSDQEIESNLNQMVSVLGQTSFPGSEETPLDLGLQGAQDLLASFPDISNEEAVNEYARTNNIQLNRFNRREVVQGLVDRKRNLEKAVTLMNAVFEIGTKANRTAEDISQVRAAFGAFSPVAGEARASFSAVFRDIMTSRAVSAPQLADRIRAFQTDFETYENNISIASRYRQLLNQNDLQDNGSTISIGSGLQDAGHLTRTQNALKPYLKGLLDGQLSRMSGELNSLSSLQTGPTTDASVINFRQRKVNETIWPMLRACSQLRSVMAETGRRGAYNVGAQNSACNLFRCQNTPRGLTNFADYLAEKNIGGINTSNCDGNCLPHYAAYICSRRDNLNDAKRQFESEFEQNGTICGQRVASSR